VQCTRKTEVRSWRTLFSNLPPPEELFEESLQRGNLKTAGGYLLVLHTFEELRPTGDQVVRLIQRAKDEQDWELCKELARFLMALDESGATLRSTLELVELKSPSAEPDQEQTHFTFDTTRLNIPLRARSNGHRIDGSTALSSLEETGNLSPAGSPVSPGMATRQGAGDYFGHGLGATG